MRMKERRKGRRNTGENKRQHSTGKERRPGREPKRLRLHIPYGVYLKDSNY